MLALLTCDGLAIASYSHQSRQGEQSRGCRSKFVSCAGLRRNIDFGWPSRTNRATCHNKTDHKKAVDTRHPLPSRFRRWPKRGVKLAKYKVVVDIRILYHTTTDRPCTQSQPSLFWSCRYGDSLDIDPYNILRLRCGLGNHKSSRGSEASRCCAHCRGRISSLGCC